MLGMFNSVPQLPRSNKLKISHKDKKGSQTSLKFSRLLRELRVFWASTCFGVAVG